MDGEKAVETEQQHDAEEGYPPSKVVIPAIAAVYLAVFLIAQVWHSIATSNTLLVDRHSQDRTILGTAVPSISNEFQSFGDISWYEAGFLLPLCVLQLTFERVYVS